MSDRERNYRVLTACLAACAAFVFAFSVLHPGPIAVSPVVLRDALILGVLAIVAEEMAVEVTDRLTIASGNLPILLAVMFTGRLPALLVALLVGVWGCWRETSKTVAVYNAANHVVSAFLALLVFDVFADVLNVSLDRVSLGLLLAGAAAAVTFEAANIAMVGFGIYVKYGKRIQLFLSEEMGPFLRSLAVLLLLGLAIAALYATAGPDRRGPTVRAALRKPVHVQVAGSRARACCETEGVERPVPRDEHRTCRSHGRPS